VAEECTERFARVGLKMKDKKTKGMAIDGEKPPTMMSQEAFDQKRGVGQCRTHRERGKARAQCQLCGVMSQNSMLARHQLAGVCKRGREEWATSPENSSSNQQTPSQATESILEEEPCLPQERCVGVLAGGAEKIQCPVQDCSGEHTSKQGMRSHFRDRHMEDTIFSSRKAVFQDVQDVACLRRRSGRVTKLQRCAKMPPRGGRSKQ
jgi:hypothetical protein